MEIRLNTNSQKKIKFEIDDCYEAEENFTNILSISNEREIREGVVVSGVVQGLSRDYVLVCIGSKSEGKIPKKEFANGGQDIEVGSVVQVYLEKIENREGTIVLSREKAIRYEIWDKLESAYNDSEEVEGVIVSSVKSGCIVDLGNILAFLPSSHLDLKVVKDVSQFIGKRFKFRILKMDKKQGNIVVSRRVVLNSANADARNTFLGELQEGQIMEGIVKSITNYGVFAGIHESPEVGVIDGLIHITDISWSRVSHPSAFYSYGQKIKVKVIGIDRENQRISLGIKQLVDNPWKGIESQFPIGTKHKGVITSIEEYGVFVELVPGIEGLVHLSEISWIKGQKPLSRGQEVEVMVIAIDTARCRMSLSIRQCADNPWEKFIDRHSLGSSVYCKIKSIVDSGVVFTLEENSGEVRNLEGFMRNTDISDNPHEIKDFKRKSVGENVEVKIIQVNVNKAIVMLGLRQLTYDPFEEFLSTISTGDIITASISRIDGKGAHIYVRNNVSIFVDQSGINDLSSISVGDEKEFQVIQKDPYEVKLKLVAPGEVYDNVNIGTETDNDNQ